MKNQQIPGCDVCQRYFTALHQIKEEGNVGAEIIGGIAFDKHLTVDHGIYNPVPHEIWEARDGGRFFILERTPKMVRVQRRPFGDSQAEPYWMRLTTFGREAIY